MKRYRPRETCEKRRICCNQSEARAELNEETIMKPSRLKGYETEERIDD